MAAEPALGIDEEVETIAGYAHDVGYAGLFRGGQPVNRATVRDQKSAHMFIGARRLATLLQRHEFDYLSQKRKGRACHLVFVHDMVEYLKEPDEIVLMEADTLAAFDPAVESTYSVKDKNSWRAKAIERRVPRFMTDYSRRKIIEMAVANPSHIDHGLMERLVEIAGDR